MKSDVSVADTNACVLEMEIVNNAVPPAVIELGEKLFETAGLEGETVSMSATVQVPLGAQDPLVLVTLTGGEMTAVLVT